MLSADKFIATAAPAIGAGCAAVGALVSHGPWWNRFGATWLSSDVDSAGIDGQLFDKHWSEQLRHTRHPRRRPS